MKLKVFLDTSVLLKGFSAYRDNISLPSCIVDESVKKFTFEKCVFEAYMCFRGVSGKKPDEGRGRWAESNLIREKDPASFGKLISQYHHGNKIQGSYWINQILEAGAGIDSFVRHAELCVGQDDPERVYTEAQTLKELINEREKFEALCWDFVHFLQENSIHELSYMETFDCRKDASRFINPRCLDTFVRDTIIPSEDFEIVYAAMNIPADILVTDDERLISCSMSLGSNMPLSGYNFCKSINYDEKLKSIQELRGVV